MITRAQLQHLVDARWPDALGKAYVERPHSNSGMRDVCTDARDNLDFRPWSDRAKTPFRWAIVHRWQEFRLATEAIDGKPATEGYAGPAHEVLCEASTLPKLLEAWIAFTTVPLQPPSAGTSPTGAGGSSTGSDSGAGG